MLAEQRIQRPVHLITALRAARTGPGRQYGAIGIDPYARTNFSTFYISHTKRSERAALRVLS